MSTILDKIRSRGYWRVVLRPRNFNNLRIQDFSTLYPIIQKTSVQLGGWSFPFIHPGIEPERHVDWISQESEWAHYLEAWRFYRSGQFVDYFGVWSDWRNQPPSSLSGNTRRGGGSLGIKETMLRFTQICEFAARLAFTPAGGAQMQLAIAIRNIRDRRLWADSPSLYPMIVLPMAGPYTTSLNEFLHKIEVSRSDLVAQPRQLALEASLQLFQRFGWNPSIDSLRLLQGEIRP